MSRSKLTTKINLDDNGDKIAWPEPEPNFDIQSDFWGCLWLAYGWTFALVYTCITVLAVIMLVLTLTTSGFKKRSKSVVSLISMILSCTITRAILLTVESIDNQTHFFILRILFSLGTPGLTASFMNLVLIILDTTSFHLSKPRFLTFRFVLAMYVLHLSLAIFTDVVIMTQAIASGHHLMLFYHLFYVTYGYLTSVGFIYAFKKLKKNLSASKYSNDMVRPRLELLYKLSFTAGIVAALLGTVNLYKAVGHLGFASRNKDDGVHPGRWMLVHTLIRTLECIGCLLVLLAFLKIANAQVLRRTVQGIPRLILRPKFSNTEMNSTITAGMVIRGVTFANQMVAETSTEHQSPSSQPHLRAMSTNVDVGHGSKDI